MTEKTIVLIEDDHEIARLATMFLKSEGFLVLHVDNGSEAVRFVEQHSPALVVLDVMLPGKSGIDVCKELQQSYPGPVLMLTACDDDITEISALNTGADDYLTKPIRPHVLLAHINALLRRYSPDKAPEQIHSGDISIHLQRREVRYADQLIHFSTAEFDLIALLADTPGEAVPRETCYRVLRGIEYDGLDRAMDVRVSSIRKKLLDAGCHTPLIKTIRSKGYLLLQDL